MEGNASFTDKIVVQVSITKDSIKEAAKEFASETSKAVGTGLKDGIKDAYNGIKTVVKNRLVNLLTDVADSIVDLFKNSFKEMFNMLEYSQLSNASTRELAFGYGFSSSEAYGWTKAMKQLGFSSEEDLMYANSQEIKQFRQAFEKYASYYDHLAESGYFETLQEYQVEMEDFKMQMQQELIQFFIDNKDVIMDAMRAVLAIAKAVVKTTSWMFGSDSSSKVASTADIVSQYNTTTNANRNASLNVTNNFNSSDGYNPNDLSREVNAEYRQIIKSLEG